MSEHCIYISRHIASGKYYIGKGKTKLVESGRYKGSGTLMLRALSKHPKHEWETKIIETFETAELAYLAEGKLVTQEVVDDPLSLNLKTGGVGNCKHSAETKLRMSQTHRATRPPMSEERRKHLSMKGAERRGWKHTDESRAKMSQRMKDVARLRKESQC